MSAAMADYAELLRATEPRVIRTAKQNEHYIEELERLDSIPNPTKQERDLADLLTVLIEDYEEKHYALTPADPLSIIRELMDAQGLKQKGLTDVFGTESVASEVLNGKRTLTLTHLKRLAAKFHVSPAVFLEAL